MLDLDTRVDLDKVDAPRVDEELARSGVAVPDLFRNLDGAGEQLFADLVRQVGRRAEFDDFLVPTLDRAVALKEVDDVAVRVTEHLHFDVTRFVEVAFDKDGSVSERGFGFRDGRLERRLERRGFADDPHAATAAAHRCFDDDGEAVLLDKGVALLEGRDRAGGAGNDGDVDLERELPRGNLVAEAVND